MNWYLVQNGVILTRYDELPKLVTYPDGSVTEGLWAMSEGDLVALGLFRAEPAGPQPEIDFTRQKGLIRPVPPTTDDLAVFATDYADYKATVAKQTPVEAPVTIDPSPVPITIDPIPELEPPEAPRVVEQWEVVALSNDELAQARLQAFYSVRKRRDGLLFASDWTMLPDAPFTPEQKQAWVDYRQVLRNLPDIKGEPEDVVFPDAPVGTDREA